MKNVIFGVDFGSIGSYCSGIFMYNFKKVSLSNVYERLFWFDCIKLKKWMLKCCNGYCCNVNLKSILFVILKCYIIYYME